MKSEGIRKMELAIEVKNLVKAYGEFVAVKGITFEVRRGEIFALLGINGAGKTTTLECIEGLRKHGEGKIEVVGNIGVQLQSSSLPSHINVMETIKLFSLWNGAPVDLGLLERFGLLGLKSKQYKELSTGQKRRLHLALALIKNPDILFLDEPTAGLDVEGRAALHKELRSLKELGKTIIMASHDMAEVESLCDRIAIIKKGEIAFIGDPKDLRVQITKESRILVRLDREIGFKDLNYEYSKYGGAESGYSVFVTESVEQCVMELMGHIKEARVRSGDVEILDLKLERESLEQRFLELSKEVSSDVQEVRN